MAAKSLDPDAADYYQLLDVPLTASAAEIRRAYSTAIKRAHPDRQRPEQRAAAEELTKLLNRAYATLVDPEYRLVYDRTIRAQRVQDQIMRRYAGGSGGSHPVGTGQFNASGDAMRRSPSVAERRELARADRSALLSLIVIFGAITLIVIGLLLLSALLGALLRSII